MKKILFVLSLIVFGFILVSCSETVYKVEDFISVNKQIYTQEDLVNNRIQIKEGDFEYYHIQSNHSAEKQTVSITSITTTNLGNGIYQVNLPNTDVKYNVFLTTEGIAGDSGIAVSNFRVNFPEDATDDEKKSIVANYYFTRVISEPDYSTLELIANQYDAASTSDLLVYAYGEYDINWGNFEENKFDGASETRIVFSALDNAIEKTILNRMFRPADNQLPIHVNLKNNFIGYIWDFALIIPISFVLQFFSSLVGNSFAVGIIFATIIVRTCAWPIYAKSTGMSVKMNLMQPELNKLNQKYATRKDPASQQKMQFEMMALYKKHGVSFLGCLTPILQMPLFFAMFQVVQRVTVSGGMFADQVRNQTLFFGAIDLTTGSFTDIWNIIFAAIVGATMILLQQISKRQPSYAKKTGTQVKSAQAQKTEQTMKTVNVIMVVMMVVTTLSMPKALGLYWVIGNLYSLVQTIINRKLQEKKYYKEKAKQSIV